MKLEENVMRILANRFEDPPKRGDTSRGVQGMQLLLLLQHLLDLLHFLGVAVFFQTWFKACKTIHVLFDCSLSEIKSLRNVFLQRTLIPLRYMQKLIFPHKVVNDNIFWILSWLFYCHHWGHPWHWQLTLSYLLVLKVVGGRPTVPWHRSSSNATTDHLLFPNLNQPLSSVKRV